MPYSQPRGSGLEKRLQKRSRIIQSIRDFFVSGGFLEVETPILAQFAGQEPYLDPMKVKFKGGSGYLITSPEYAHKKLLAAGFKKTFEITKCFRDGEPTGGLHNSEFTMLEWYRAHADYLEIMKDVEQMVKYVFSAIASPRTRAELGAGFYSAKQSRTCLTARRGSPRSLRSLAMTILYQGHEIDLSSPWERITVREAFKRYADTRLEKVRNDTDFFKIFLTRIEPKLGFPKPTILYEYPARMASLARVVTRPQRRSGLVTKQFAERFELYIAGIELANAFSELNDAQEQRRRFLQEQKLRKKLGKEIIPIDEDFLNALGHMPPAAGIALGVDRLVMLLTGAEKIEDVLAFPMRKDTTT